MECVEQEWVGWVMVVLVWGGWPGSGMVVRLGWGLSWVDGLSG